VARDWALFLHLVGVLLFTGASVTVTALRLLAIGKSRPSESALLLRAVRPIVPLVGLGLVLTVGAGAWLAHELGVSYGAGWLRWTYVLLGWLVVVGAVGGRLDRKPASSPSVSPRKATGLRPSSRTVCGTRSH
jgi:uncharacterized membrane protein